MTNYGKAPTDSHLVCIPQQAGPRKQFLSGKATAKGSDRGASMDASVRSMETFFHLYFSVVWIGSHSTSVLYTALLTAEYAEGDRAQSEGQQCPQAL